MPAVAVPDVVEQCGRRGVRAAVVVSSGLTGTPAGARLVEAARNHGMRLVGPNCVGVANTDPATRLNATFLPGPVPEGRVGVVSQSGGFGIALLEWLRRLGIGVSSLVSTGDKYDVSGNDLLMWWHDDPRTELAVLYLESFGNPRKFSLLARTLSRRKPVLAIRTGDTPVAQRAAASHTAAAATPVVTRDALYRQAGVIAVDSMSELLDVIAVRCWQPMPRGNRVAILSNAGGVGVVAADACGRRGLVLPELRAETTEALGALLPEHASTRNPVDTTAAVDPAAFGGCLDALARDDAVDAVMVATVPTAVGDPGRELAARIRGLGKPVLLVAPGRLERLAAIADDKGKPVTAAFADPVDAAAALAHLGAYARWRTQPEGVVPELPGIDREAAHRLVAGRSGWLSPMEAVELVRCFGIPAIDTRYALDEDTAVAHAGALSGAVAVKADAEGLLHKESGGGVRLNVRGGRAVRAAVRALRRRFGDALRGVAIQPMVAPGREMLIGIHSDPVFGPLVVYGLGGTDTDVIADRATPLTDADADRLADSMHASATLTGAPDWPAGAVRDVLLRVGRLADLVPEIVELDLNPMVASGSGCVVVDVRVRLEPRPPGDPFLRHL